MSIDAVALLALVALLSLFLYKHKKNLQISSFFRIFYFAMYRTRLGMSAMERWARNHETILRKAGYVMIPVGFLGMLIMLEELFRGALTILKNTDALTVGVVLPIQATGVFYVPFFYWFLSILFIMAVHEFGHGIIARAHKVRVKSTGFAFLGALIPIIPGAFVEIDEKHLARQSKYVQLSIFAAGPFVNIVFGLLFWGAFIALQPATAGLFVSDGMEITSVAANSPAAISGLAVGDLITQIDNADIRTVADFERAFAAKQPGDTLAVATAKGLRDATLAGTDKAYLGVQVQEATRLKESVIASHGTLLPTAFSWLTELVFWLFLLNLGVGLFNLVPLGPIDGGRMLHTALQHLVRHQHARRVWHAVSTVMLVIIVGTLLSAFV
jgi:membrane-associated protease RseP (regulator of RpoE activity)